MAFLGRNTIFLMIGAAYFGDHLIECTGAMIQRSATLQKFHLDHDKTQYQKEMDIILRWDSGTCSRLKVLFSRKSLAMTRIEEMVQRIHINKAMSELERNYHVTRLEAFNKQLNETEYLIAHSIHWLRDVLNGDYRDIINELDSSKARLEALRGATLQEEQEYNAILEAEEQLKTLNKSRMVGMIDEILNEVADAADQLEKDLDDHVFEDAVKDPEMAKGANIEAVIRLEDENSEVTIKNSTRPGGVMKLVDVAGNQFVLAKGKDSTIPQEDHRYIQDVIFLVILSTILGWLCSLTKLPSMFGYVMAGILLGPSGFNILKSLVQVETLGEFGVFFILFTVGLEFSPDKLKKVIKVAVPGSVLMMAFTVVCGLVIGKYLGAQVNESAFVAACISLSSTPLVVKFLNPGGTENGDDSPSNAEYGMVLLGILIMQDVLLGVLIALLPSLAPASTEPGETVVSTAEYLDMGLKIVGALLLVLTIAWVGSTFLLGTVYKFLQRWSNRELTILVTITLAFVMILLTDSLHVSMELGSFMAGVMLSAQGHDLASQLELLIQPVKDFLAILFFASIGLHVFPSFMLYQLTYLVTFTLLIVAAKFVISALVLSLLVPKTSSHVRWIASAGLAQVSEFSFVLSSRARRLRIINREVYLLILSVTTLSLLFAPVLWLLTLWQQRVTVRKQTRRNNAMMMMKSASTAPLMVKAENTTARVHHPSGSDAGQTSLHVDNMQGTLS